MAISQKLLMVAATDVGTQAMLAGMVGNDETVKNGDRWAKFQKIGSRQYKIVRAVGEEPPMEDEVTSPAVAKMMVIQHVAVAPKQE